MLVREYWMYSLGFVALCVFGVRSYLQTQDGRYKWDRFKLRMPVIGKLMYESMLSRINRSMAISLAAGMPMTQTLAVIARSSGNVFVSEKIQILASSVERGESLHRAATASGMFSPLVLQMIAIGEETGALPELLDEAAGYYEREVDHAVKNLSCVHRADPHRGGGRHGSHSGARHLHAAVGSHQQGRPDVKPGALCP